MKSLTKHVRKDEDSSSEKPEKVSGKDEEKKIRLEEQTLAGAVKSELFPMEEDKRMKDKEELNSLADRTTRTEQILNEMKKKDAERQNEKKRREQQVRIAEANRSNSEWAAGGRNNMSQSSETQRATIARFFECLENDILMHGRSSPFQISLKTAEILNRQVLHQKLDAEREQLTLRTQAYLERIKEIRRI
ncbi:hypothetical protein BDZ45DRAFT_735439 [Acephala macrosclerotiorum]|nr:hypothetical protein BDZ45DRAFT_735439 [Acephala macrosclerotiorum]